MATIFDGIKMSEEIRNELRENATELAKNTKRKPKLVIFFIGLDPPSHAYIQRKIEACEYIGIDCEFLNPLNITEIELINQITKLNYDNSVDGILVQLPLPENIDKLKIFSYISPDKDVDGFNERNFGKLCLEIETFIPCAALSVLEIIKRNHIIVKGKNVVIIGTSKYFGLPIAIVMQNIGLINDENYTSGMSGTVTMCNVNTPREELKKFCINADIIISVVGKPNFITSDFIKAGAIIIDAGIAPIGQDSDGKIIFTGDVDFDGVKDIAGFITPVPGGVGPITIAMLMKNVLRAAKLNFTKKYNSNAKSNNITQKILKEMCCLL